MLGKKRKKDSDQLTNQTDTPDQENPAGNLGGQTSRDKSDTGTPDNSQSSNYRSGVDDNMTPDPGNTSRNGDIDDL